MVGISISVNAQTDSVPPPYPVDSLGNTIYPNTDSSYNEEVEEKFEPFDPTKYYSKEYAESKIQVRNFDTAEWRKLTEKLDYKEPTPQIVKQKKYTPFQFSDGFIAFLKIFMWLIVIAGLTTLIWLFYKRGGFNNLLKRNNKLQSAESLIDYNTIDEEEITNNDFPTLIKAALRDQNYVMALRLNYLYALKSLEEADLIRWKRDKTNGNYVRELGSSPEFQSPFKTLTRQFEIYFYGKFPLNEIQYNNIAVEFNEFIQKTQLLASKNLKDEGEKNI